jgi:hypothetical protein
MSQRLANGVNGSGLLIRPLGAVFLFRAVADAERIDATALSRERQRDWRHCAPATRRHDCFDAMGAEGVT